MNATPWTLTVEESARWRARIRAAFARRSLDALAQLLGASADSEILPRLRDLQAGREAGLRFFLASPERSARLAQVLEVAPTALHDWLAQCRSASPAAPRALNDGLSAELALAAEPNAPFGHLAPPGLSPGPTPRPPDVWELGAARRLDQLLTEAAGRIGEDRDQVPALRRIMIREAIDLCTLGHAPTAPLGPATALVEGELARATALKDRPLLRPLRRLLSSYREIGVRARLFRQEQGQICFASAELPALLLGAVLAAGRDETLRERCATQRAWALAAWAATQGGDAVAGWLQPLLAEGDPLRQVERALTACAALGGAQSSAYTPVVAGALRLCVDVLCWLCPVDRDDLGASQTVEASPWELVREDWQRAVLVLAQASLRLGADEAPRWPDSAADDASPLRAVRAALHLPTQLEEEDARVVRALCLPWQSAARGDLDERFFQRCFAVNRRVSALIAEPFLETWMRTAALPALQRLHTGDSVVLLTEPSVARPAGYLMNRPSLVRAWYGAWQTLAAGADPAALARLWVEATQRLLFHEEPQEEARQVLLEEAPIQLQQLGQWDRALAGLRAALKGKHALPSRDEVTGGDLSADGSRKGEDLHTLLQRTWRHKQRTAVLQLAALSPVEWSEIIAGRHDELSLAWRLFLDAGAPQDAIARWCVAKLRRFRALPANTPRGAIGVQVVVKRGDQWIHDTEAALGSAAGWQRAFDQAEEALRWLLDQGDAAAFTTLATACYLEEPAFDYKLGTLPANFALMLSQSLWSFASACRGGCEALLAWVEAGHPLPAFLIAAGTDGIPIEIERLWLALQFSTVLAPRAYPAFRLWLQQQGVPWEAPHALRLKLMATNLAAQAGVDVGPAVAPLLAALTTPSDHADVVADIEFCEAIAALAQHHPTSAQAVLEQALQPVLLAHLCRDGTEGFWRLLIAQRGAAAVLETLALQQLGDLGGGLFTALLEQAPALLQEVHLQRSLRRPALFAAAAGRFTPDERFWAEAWADPAALPPLTQLGQLPAGAWLASLLAHLTTWPVAEHRRVLARLAGFAADPAVRRACLAALLALPPEIE